MIRVEMKIVHNYICIPYFQTNSFLYSILYSIQHNTNANAKVNISYR